jgi:DNA ligase 1
MHFIDSLYDKLEQMGATASANAKLEIVKTLTPAELSVVQLALDPSVNFYIAKLPLTASGSAEWGAREFTLLDDLASRKITGYAARSRVFEVLEDLKMEHASVLRRVILKDLKVKVGETLVNRAFPGTIPVTPYMRCSLPDKSNMPKWTDEDWFAGIISQEKADGMFASLTCYDGYFTVASRQGSVFPGDILEPLFSELRGRVTLDLQLHGELLVYKDEVLLERQVGNGILNSLLQGGELPEGHEIRYLVWDLIPRSAARGGGRHDRDYDLRLNHLKTLVYGLKTVSLIPTRVVHSKADAVAHYRDLLAQGKEGTILKHPHAIWKDGTSKDLVKMKLEVDVELQVTGFVPGNGKNADTFGSLTCTSACGDLVVDVSGFTDAKRKELHERGEGLMGQVITVRANGVLYPSPSNDKHSLFLPRFVEERLDKREADHLEQIIDQFKAAVGA